MRRRLARVRRRLDVAVWLEAVGLTGWGFAAALVAWHVFIHAQALVAVPLLLAATAWATARRARPRLHSEAEAAALVDRLAGAGGLLLTRLERPVDEWELSLNQRLAQVQLPAPVLAPLRRWVPIAVFLAAGLALPRWEVAKGRPNAAAAARVAQVKTLAEAIQNVAPLDEALAAELAQLEQRLAAGDFTGADWEAADALEKRLEAAAVVADQGLEKASALAEALAAAQSSDEAAREREALEKALLELGLDGSGARADQ
ncbi:MAG: hypothetical protein JNG84_07930, partial [Archangium sp.]|nr:hypothetical protein [Archangium sp.]